MGTRRNFSACNWGATRSELLGRRNPWAGRGGGGNRYAPIGPDPLPAAEPGAFVFAAAFLEHGHIYGQTEGLTGAGGECRWVYDPDPAKFAAFCRQFPGVRVARSLKEILDDEAVHLVSAAAIPNERAGIGLRVMAAGMDYFTDKAPFTSVAQLADVRQAIAMWYVL